MSTDLFRMHVLAAGHGDCLWIEVGKADAPTRLLIDAGTTSTFKRLAPLLTAVRGATPSHALFLVTHIDADHIGGALKVLGDPSIAHQFKEVWFNGRRHLEAAQAMQPFGAVQGEKLSKAILDLGLSWNTSVAAGPLMRTPGKPLITRTLGDAVVTVLTPTPKELAALLPKWDDEIRKAGLAPKVNAALPVATVPEGFEAFGAIDVAALAAKVVPEDTAPANASSISTLIEFKGKRLLLGADAHPSVLLAGIRQLQPEGRLKVDVFKLPHHGSSANLSMALLDAVDAKVIVVSSNGAYFGHPDQVAIARVLTRYQSQGVDIVFNYRSEFTSPWDSDSLRAKWNYTTRYGVGEHGITVALL